MNRFLKISGFVLLIVSVVGLLAFVGSRPHPVKCNQVTVKIDYTSDRYFVTETEITSIVEQFCDSSGGSNQLDEKTRLRELEKQVMGHPAIKKCEIYTTVNGAMTVEVQQRVPICRVINALGESYYMDQDGKLMPIMPGRPSRVAIVNGRITESYAPNPYYLDNDSAAKISVLDEVFQMMQFIDRDTFWHAMIEQVYITDNREFILIPKVGMQEIEFGKAEHIKGKFNKLRQFYEKGITADGWRMHKTLDARYKGQVIGRGPEIPNPNDSLITETITDH